MIKSFLREDHRLWDEHLHEFSFAVNNSIQDSSRFSPFFLNYGRNPVPPFSIMSEDVPRKKFISSDPKIWGDRMLRLQAYHDLIRRFLFKASARQAKYYNKGRKKVRFQLGDPIMKKEHYLSSAGKRFSAKLAHPFSGPHKVTKVVSPNVYEIETPSKHQSPRVHVMHMKPFSCDSNVNTMLHENSRFCNAISDNNPFQFQMFRRTIGDQAIGYVAYVPNEEKWVKLLKFEVLLYEADESAFLEAVGDRYELSTITPIFRQYQIAQLRTTLSPH